MSAMLMIKSTQPCYVCSKVTLLKSILTFFGVLSFSDSESLKFISDSYPEAEKSDYLRLKTPSSIYRVSLFLKLGLITTAPYWSDSDSLKSLAPGSEIRDRLKLYISVYRRRNSCCSFCRSST